MRLRRLSCVRSLACAALWATACAAIANPASAATPNASPADVFAHPVAVSKALQVAKAAVDPLAQAKVVRGQFVQRRSLAELPRPLVSRGDFVFARDVGVAWHTAEPFESRVALGPRGLVQSDASGETLRVDADREPALRFVSTVFVALFSLDVQRLATDFELFALPTSKGWTLGLRPRAAAVRGVVAEAIVSGDSRVERVVLRDARGDRTEIDLADVRYETAPLSDTERAQF